MAINKSKILVIIKFDVHQYAHHFQAKKPASWHFIDKYRSSSNAIDCRDFMAQNQKPYYFQ